MSEWNNTTNGWCHLTYELFGFMKHVKVIIWTDDISNLEI